MVITDDPPTNTVAFTEEIEIASNRRASSGKGGGLVSNRVKMYETSSYASYGSRKTYHQRSQDSFHPSTLSNPVDARDEIAPAATTRRAASAARMRRAGVSSGRRSSSTLREASPTRVRAPSPSRLRAPSPARSGTRSSTRSRDRSPVRARDPSPARVRAPSPSPARTMIRSSGNPQSVSSVSPESPLPDYASSPNNGMPVTQTSERTAAATQDRATTPLPEREVSPPKVPKNEALVVKKAYSKVRKVSKSSSSVPKSYAGSALVESGVEYYSQGDYEKSLKAFNAALRTQRVVGKKDVSVALTLGNLGAVFLQMNNLDDAESVLLESLEIKREIAPDMIVADTLNNLGNVANLRGEHEDSLIFYEEALEDIRNKKGRVADEINALFNIGRLEIQRQHWTKATIALQEARILATTQYGKNHLFVAQTLDLIGFAQLSTAKIDDAMVSFTGALAIHRRLHGPMHIEVANSLFNVGMVREAKGDLADAWEAYTTARDLYSRLGVDHQHPGFITVRRNIANVEKVIASQLEKKQNRRAA